MDDGVKRGALFRVSEDECAQSSAVNFSIRREDAAPEASEEFAVSGLARGNRLVADFVRVNNDCAEVSKHPGDSRFPRSHAAGQSEAKGIHEGRIRIVATDEWEVASQRGFSARHSTLVTAFGGGPATACSGRAHGVRHQHCNR